MGKISGTDLLQLAVVAVAFYFAKETLPPRDSG